MVMLRHATNQLDKVVQAAKYQVANADVGPTSAERRTVERQAVESIEGVVETAKAAISAV